MPIPPGYPVNLVLAGRRCLVVGGGRVAAQKARELLACGAHVHLVAPEIGPEVDALTDDGDGVRGGDRHTDGGSGDSGSGDGGTGAHGGRLAIERRTYRATDLDGCRLAIAATDDPDVNAAVFADGEAAGTWVNSADDPAHCAFTLPARIRQGPLLVTFSTSGRSPAVATWLRRHFSAEFGPEYAQLIDLVAEARESVRASGGSTEGLDWQSALDSGMLDLIRRGRITEAKELLRSCLAP